MDTAPTSWKYPCIIFYMYGRINSIQFNSIQFNFSLFFPIPGGAEDITVVDIGIPHGPDLKCRHKYV